MRDGMCNGMGETQFKSGSRYEGEYLDGKWSGKGSFTWPNGARHVGDFAEGKMKGKGTRTWPDGASFSGDFIDAETAGAGLYTAPNGIQFEAKYSGGRAYPTGNGTMPCKQVAPAIPRAALDSDIQGQVVARLILGKGEKKVEIISGPPLFHAAVIEAMGKYECGPVDRLTGYMQTFNFTVSSWEPIWQQSRSSRKPLYVASAPQALVGIPFGSAWEELDPKQQAWVRSLYPGLKKDEIPPFPSRGLGMLFEEIRLAAQQLQMQGKVKFSVHVAANGSADSVQLDDSPNKAVGKRVTDIALATKFKPATCDGSPCAMDFFVEIEITRQ